MTTRRHWVALAVSIFAVLQCPKTGEDNSLSFEVAVRGDSILTYRAPPPSIIYFHLAISNTGSADDSFSVSLKDWVVPAGWTLRLCDVHG